MGAVEFTQRRGKVEADADAEEQIKRKLADSMVETRGVCIQGVVLPERESDNDDHATRTRARPIGGAIAISWR
jgi:hypothetical protein